MHETPKIKAILEIFEPIIVPRANSSLSLMTADIPIKISGNEVPSATTLKPIIKSLMPKLAARADALSINLLAPHINNIRERTYHETLPSKDSILLFYIGNHDQIQEWIYLFSRKGYIII